MNPIKSVLKNVLKRLAEYRAILKLKRLNELNEPAINKMAAAILEALKSDVTAAEDAWIRRIEEMRSTLIESSLEVTFADYGAGKSNLNRTEKEMYEGIVSATSVSNLCKASKSYFWALVLFKLVRKFRPVTSIELGTCLGISAAYQAAALKLNGKGLITTLEGATSLASLSERNLRELRLDNAIVVSGRFQDNLEGVLRKTKPIDYAFIDGHHDEKATISYFTTFIPYLAAQSVIVFDDISWSDGMRRAWRKIVENENVKIAVDLGAIGICILDRDVQGKFVFRIPLI